MICSSCKTTLPEGHPYRFCPFCGTPVAAASVAATEAYPVAPSARPVVRAEPEARDTEEDVPSVPTSAAASAAEPEAPTRYDLPAVRTPQKVEAKAAPKVVPKVIPKATPRAAPTAAPRPAPKPASAAPPPSDTAGLSGPMSEDDVPSIHTISAAQPELPKPQAASYDQDAKTVLSLPAVTAADLARLLNQDEAPAPAPAPAAPAPAPAAAEPAKAKGKKGFSETAWFMAAVTPDQLEEVEAHNPAEAEVYTEKYETQAPLPDPVRKQFSLSAGDTREVPTDDGDKPDKGLKKLKKKK